MSTGGRWVKTPRGDRFCPAGKTIKGSVPIDAKGEWVSSSSGGVWFRPLGWRPKLHLLDNEDAPLCGNRGLYAKSTSKVDDVTCGSCRNQMLIRRFKVLMFLVAVLVWARTHPEKARGGETCG